MKEQLLNKLIESLTNEPEKWEFGEYTVQNREWGIQLWIANIPLLNLMVYKPTKISFSLMGRIRLYRALNYCKAKSILLLKKGITTPTD
jgi:hypothetical protein